jgi:3-hydroxyacyl-[acyl-carrier-protein] dehydratase
MNAAEIEQKIPHRPPMRLLDEIVSQSESEVVCRKTFHADEPFLQGHFPGFPLVPGVILCECCLQAGAVLLADQSVQDDSMVPIATRMDGVKFKRMVRPGDTVEIRATLNEKISTAFFMTGKMTVGGKLAVRLDFACSVAPIPMPNKDATGSGAGDNV